ncbi:MAG: DUF5752 family protein [Ignavibacteriae bacterium]|nr:DUF5752 family protein [Ignavibacteriota bacterium]
MSEFYFDTKLDQPILLGIKARNLSELLAGMQSVPESSIYYHTHRYLRQHHFLSPEPPNDFAYWITDVLNEDRLAERVSSVDIIQFQSLEALRREFIDILQSHMESSERSPSAPAGEEFHFMAARTFVLHTPHVAHNVGEFVAILKEVTPGSLYYHIFEAKLRLEKGENDFSRWFRDQGKTELADRLTRLDPYTYTLEGLRNKMIQLVEKYG